VLAAVFGPAATDETVVRVDGGWLRGTGTAEYQRFRGIPFAAPPVGDLRWRSPRPPARWDGVRDATRPGSRCAQRAGGSEDCLYLDVTAPTTPGRKPVVVWLHGGGFLEEAGSDYDTRELAVRGDVVVVSPNYRLGIFGLLAYPGLTGSGGFALEDQQAALRWVRRNVDRFGGDPGNVTLVGESAGGKSACAHLASPSAAGLFDKVVLQSAPCTGTVPAGAMFPGLPAFPQWAPTAARAPDGAAVALSLGCRDLRCLRGLPTRALLEHHAAFMSPTYGSAVLPVDPDAAISAGRTHRMPVVSGITRDEMALMGTAAEYETQLATAFGADAGRVAARYPAGAWAAVTTDRVFACPAVARDAALARRMPVWSYEFAEPGPDGLAAHGSDLPYLFPEYGSVSPLSARMIGHWATFAHTGRPGWPDHPATAVLASGGPALVDLGATHQCDFWATVHS
jgi:para-nitrobenzyl esterase